jgi:hypothetical protein
MQKLVNATDVLTIKPSPEKCFQSKVPNYALLFFDHLHSEYLALKPSIRHERVITLLDSIYEKRAKCELTWSDIYTFDLALIDERPLENLIRKGYDARSKYRSIAGQKEYDEYLASKPPDLTAILIRPNALGEETQQHEDLITSPPTSPPAILSPPVDPSVDPEIPRSTRVVERVLRADIRYLLSKFYLYYAMLPMREGLREQLTKRAVRMTIIILIIIVLLAMASLGGLKIFTSSDLKQIFDVTGVFGITVGSVACAGIIGGCVSMLQRIQSAPTEGDALFNLAALNNGWIGLSLSPLYGAIFATLLFILFAAGILKGSVFPTIETAGSDAIVERQEKPASEATTPTPTPTPATPAAAPGAALSPTVTPTPTPTPTATPSPSPTPSLTETQRRGILQAKDFLKETGPKDGISFALLMIWSFIAGFAERLVPDTLNRLVAKTEAIQGT